MSNAHVNAVVIGAGAGGGIVARQLARAGLSVVLLERGRWHSPAEERKDDLRNQRTFALGPAYGPELAANPRVLVNARGGEQLVHADSWSYHNNAACVGGGTVSYGAMAFRFMAQDFRMKSLYGVPEGSTLDDWPLSYDELEPFYDQAEYELGVAGDVSGDPFKAPRRRPLPMPPLPDDRETQIMQPAARRLGWHPFHFPMLRNTVPYNGRPACMRCRWCVGFACECDAKTGTHNTVIPEALATRLCTLHTRCVVREIQVDRGGRARGVEYFDGDNRRQVQTADLIVVAGGAIESARLLLNSKSALFPQGLGNRHDWVGRNLQGHTYSGGLGLFEEETYDDLGPGGQIALCDFNHGIPGLVGGGMLATEFIRLPYHFLNWRPADVPRWGPAFKEFVRQYYRRSIVVIGPSQEIPRFEARVQVDPKVRDAWGIPVARLSGTDHPHNLKLSRFAADQAERWLKEAGARRVLRRQKTVNSLSGGQHQAGTCRMGNDPTTSVVDKQGRVHDVPNVFVADASLHVTNGGFNPVLTVMALAYHVAAGISKGWKGGGLR